MSMWSIQLPKGRQYALAIMAVTAIVLPSLLLHELIGYRVVALLLLVTVSFLALFLDILPLMLAAVLSALFWDFLFIPPRFQLTVGTSEDQILLLMYLVIVMVHSVLTFKIRKAQEEVRKREERARDLRFYNTLLNSLSHELRTPITTILAATDTLLSPNNQLTEANRAELLDEINIASIRLNRQVENLLGMSRLESGAIRIRRDWVDIRELIYTAIAQLEPAINKFPVTVSVPEHLPLFKVDFGLLEQVLYNLISNAVQHTPEGTNIMIAADCVDDCLFITVSDTGKGFPEKEISRVFDKFYRVDGSRPGGTGLGLSIAKGFVEAHGGHISLRNLPLSGAEFEIRIPSEVSYVNRLKNE